MRFDFLKWGGRTWAAGAFALLAFMAGGYTTDANAATSFARQTGMSCHACHTRYPSMTAVGKRFFMQGYRTPNTRPQLEQGTRGSWGGERLSFPLTEYQWWRLRISPYTKEKGREYKDPTNNDKAFALLPERVSWGATGPIGDHLGLWLEVYYSPQDAPESGFNNARGEFREGKVEFDELELVWGTEPTWASPGSWIGAYMNNRGYRKVNNRGGTGIYGSQSGAFTNSGSIGLHAFLNDHYYATIAFLPGSSKNWDRKDMQLNLAWWPFNQQQKDLWIDFLYTDVEDNPRPTLRQSVFGGNNTRTTSKAYDIRASFTIADLGPHTFDAEIGIGTTKEKLNQGTAQAGEFQGTRTGGGFRYWYKRTYGFEFITRKWLTYEESRAGTKVSLTRPDPNVAIGFMYYLATNQLVSFEIEKDYGSPFTTAADRVVTTTQLKFELGW